MTRPPPRNDFPAPPSRLRISADPGVGVLLLAVKLPEGGRGETGGPLLVEIEGRPDEGLVCQHPLADVVVGAGLVPPRGQIELQAGGHVCPLGVPPQIERTDQHVREPPADRAEELEGRRLERRVGPRKHDEDAVVRAEDLGLADVPQQRSEGADIDTAGGVGKQTDGVAVGILDGVGVVADIEEHGVEAGRGLRTGLDPVVAEGVTPIELSLGRRCKQQHHRAHRAECSQSSHRNSSLLPSPSRVSTQPFGSRHCGGHVNFPCGCGARRGSSRPPER